MVKEYNMRRENEVRHWARAKRIARQYKNCVHNKPQIFQELEIKESWLIYQQKDWKEKSHLKMSGRISLHRAQTAKITNSK
jgi:hypothetical protein